MLILNKIFCIKKDIRLRPANQYTVWKVVGLFIVGLLFAGSMLVFYFIYLYSYLTLSNSNTIIILNSNLAVDIIDIKTFKTSEEIIQFKKQLPKVQEKIRNIFYYVEPITSTPMIIPISATINMNSTTNKILFPTSSINTKIFTKKNKNTTIKK